VALKVLLMGMSPTDPLVAAALVTQEQERATGFASRNPSLEAIQNQLEPHELLRLVNELRLDGQPERELAARLLVHAALPGTAVTSEVQRLLQDEADPQVIRWLVAALQHARDPAAIGLLKCLATHPDARVRFGVPDALSSCASEFGDVADDLIELSTDGDRDVRWSATFELAAWLTGATSAAQDPGAGRALSRLREIAASDPVSEVRSMAARAVAQAHGS
jgi:hypothetical protein